jgi:hypothetical protein
MLGMLLVGMSSLLLVISLITNCAGCSPSLLQPSSTNLSLATLTLSSSSPITATFPHDALSPTPQAGADNQQASNVDAYLSTGRRPSLPSYSSAPPLSTSPNVSGLSPPTGPQVHVAPVPISKNGKRRGTDFKCESCSKVYRHPSCLIKHRWEHTPHWKGLGAGGGANSVGAMGLSKHQQVQMLEVSPFPSLVLVCLAFFNFVPFGIFCMLITYSGSSNSFTHAPLLLSPRGPLSMAIFPLRRNLTPRRSIQRKRAEQRYQLCKHGDRRVYDSESRGRGRTRTELRLVHPRPPLLVFRTRIVHPRYWHRPCHPRELFRPTPPRLFDIEIERERDEGRERGHRRRQLAL